MMIWFNTKLFLLCQPTAWWKNSGILQLSFVACNKSGSVIGEFDEHVKPLKTLLQKSMDCHFQTPKSGMLIIFYKFGHDLWPLSKTTLTKVKRVVYLLLGNHVIVSGYSL